MSALKAREAMPFPVSVESSKAVSRDFESGTSLFQYHMLLRKLLVICVIYSRMGQKVELSEILCKYKYILIRKQLPFLCGNYKQENKTPF